MIWKLRTALAAVLLSVLALPALGGTPAKIGLSVPDVASLMVYVAQDRGFYKAEGLDAELVQFESDAAAAQGLTAGAVQINCASIFPVIDSYIAGRDLAAIWSVDNQPNFIWYGLPKFASIKDLKGGGKIGVSSIGSMSHRVSVWAASRAGLNPDKDVTFVPLGGPLNRVAALKAGQVDLIPATAPGTFMLQQDGFKPLLELETLMPEFSDETFYARRANLDRDGDVLRLVIRGSIRAKHWAMAHQDEATTIFMDHLGAPADQRNFYAKTVADALPFFPDDGRFPVDSINVFLGFYKDQGKLKDIPPLSALTDARFIEYFKQHPIKD